MSPLVVSLISETCEIFHTVGTLEGAVSCMCAWMHIQVSLFGEVFVTILDGAKIENFRCNSMFVRFMNLQPILSCKTLWAESAIEQFWTVLGHLWRWNYFIMFHHLLMTILDLHLMNLSFLVSAQMKGPNRISCISWFTRILIVLFLIRFEVFFFLNYFDAVLNPRMT